MAHWRLSRRAEHDLDTLWLYGAQRFGIDQADRMLDRFEAEFRRLAAQPRSGRERDYIRPGLRSVPLEDYVIYYRLTSPGVRIVRVWDGRQNPNRLAKEI